ncbi:MAG: flagellar biosynthetic protein FliR [Sporomusaceae bacterium]|nr:flagellar biosynthetic protein FliR [Sporomusaceae bacterium]
MELLNALQNQLALFLLILVRISGMLLPAPIFGSRNIPGMLKAGLVFFLALTVLPLLAADTRPLPQTLFPYLLLAGSELIFGLVIGFASSLLFAAVQMSGSLLDMQVGFGVVNIFDPQVGQQVPLIGNFKYILALLLFLTLNGHHILLTAIVDSFRLVPVTGVVFSSAISEMMVNMISGIFTFAVQITVPILAAVIITDIGLGILARTMPQMNVFVVGVPAKIIVGLFVLSVTLPFFMLFLEAGLHGMYQDLYRLFALFAR